MSEKMKALYIVVNMGFAELVVDFIRSQGATGATIINARSVCAFQKEIMGISLCAEKEMVLTLIDRENAAKIMEAIKQDPKFKAEANAICFALPVEKAVGLS